LFEKILKKGVDKPFFSCYNKLKKRQREVNKMKYYTVQWFDKELGEIYNTITSEKGVAYMQKHPEVYDILLLDIYTE